MVTRCGVSSGQKIETFLDNLTLITGIFLGFIIYETILRVGFS
jgi:hypothetical protein